jgi:tripartite-type tricarboxylate transporter receptor subunit TctC
MMKVITAGITAVCFTVISQSSTQAQTTAPFPNKALRIIVPYPPGGTSDILSRLIGAKITENWGQTVVVENRTGANGNIAIDSLYTRTTPCTRHKLLDLSVKLNKRGQFQRIRLGNCSPCT